MTDTHWRSRIVGERDIAPEEIEPHPHNWRLHPVAQQRALAGVLDEVGWVQRVIVNRRTGRLIDGHLRVDLARERGEPSIPALEVDLDPAEEALILATLDPLAALAGVDTERLDTLIAQATPSATDVIALIHAAEDEARAVQQEAQPYTPGTQPVASRATFTEADVERAAEHLGQAFHGQPDLIDLTCPHCGTDFSIERRHVVAS